jgi:hypothetical protein
LRQTPQADYAQRTEWNVRDADATVLFSLGPRLTGGSRRTWELAVRQRKPHLHLRHAQGVLLAARRLRAFAARHRIRVLNVAGPRASSEPAVGGFVQEVLERAFPRHKELEGWRTPA